MVAGSILNGFFWNNKRCKSISMKNPLVKQYTNTVFFELLLTYQELLYFNFCLDFHMFCMYFKEFQSASAMKSSNLAKDFVWDWKFIFRCNYLSLQFIAIGQTNVTVSIWQAKSACYHFSEFFYKLIRFLLNSSVVKSDSEIEKLF